MRLTGGVVFVTATAPSTGRATSERIEANGSAVCYFWDLTEEKWGLGLDSIKRIRS
jgi:hypothetical protein